MASRKKTAEERRDPELGARLAKARKDKGYTQQQMADMFGITDVSWRHYEKGRELKSGMIIKICAVLECSPNWLLGLKEQGQHLPPESALLKALKEAFVELNSKGQQEAVKRVRELSNVPEYASKEKNPSGDMPDYTVRTKTA